jgi:hypothetical protein
MSAAKTSIRRRRSKPEPDDIAELKLIRRALIANKITPHIEALFAKHHARFFRQAAADNTPFTPQVHD